MLKSKAVVILFLCLILNFVPLNKQSSIFAQFEPHPELDWFTIETPHFFILYHSGTERTASTIAKIAEEVYGPITALYKYQPEDKITFVVNDVSDIANGATDYYGNRIEIFASALDYDLRGTHNWLRNVITHEFTHAIQIQASMRFSQSMPAVYLQWLNYEKERRPDVLYGYPNVIVSYPFSGVGVPAWYAEGTAQYQRQQLSYDYWDANRDMILRSYILDGNLLSWEEMGQFSSITSLKAESIYNLGFALTRYIAATYGEDKLRKISESLGDLSNFSMDRAMEDALGKDGKAVYLEWKAFLEKDYAQRMKGVKETEVKGELIEKLGFANYYPQFSPDGTKISYLSNQDYDYGATGLFLYDLATKKSKLLTAPVSTNYCWSPDGTKIIFAKRNSPPTIHGSVVYDLYEYEIRTDKETRLTTNFRAYSPSYSPDGKLICFVVNKDGTMNLQYADANGKNNDPLTAFNSGEQVFNPKFTPDGKKIIFDYAFEESRKIISVDIATGAMEDVLAEKGVDYRTGIFSKDGSRLFYACNSTGIFNIYEYNFDTKETYQITNVTGGAFMPSIDNKGNIAFSEYTSTGYKIALLNNFKTYTLNELKNYDKPPKLVEKYAVNYDKSLPENNYNWDSLKQFNDKNVMKLEKKEYRSQFTPLFIVPLIRFDNYAKDGKFADAIKAGLYFFSSEVINRYSVFGGAAVNKKGERDLFAQFEYNNGLPFFDDFFTKQLQFDPKFTFAGYNVSRKSNGQLLAGVDTLNVPLTYDLLSFDAGMQWKMINVNHDFRFLYTYSKYAYKLDAFALPSGVSVRSSSENYFLASNFSFGYKYNYEQPSRNSDINPIGRKIDIQYDYEISKLNPEIVVNDDGTTTTLYEKRKLHKLQAEVSQSFELFNTHSLGFKLKGAAVLGPQVEDFYNFYASGLPGMKGYPFYALGGGRMATANLTYRFPLLTKIDTRISPFYLDKLYFSLYGDFGNAWDEQNTKLSDFKKDIGAELRLQAFSWYVFPTSVFVNTAYGFDQFTKRFQGQDVTYGKEWRFYFGMLFGFDF
ncbi:MAG: biopolymer transporter Tol [Ignavibacteria bacterium]|nr:biopolymer transporter Tol [Ignavibacteria bacterium]